MFDTYGRYPVNLNLTLNQLGNEQAFLCKLFTFFIFY